MDVQPVAPSSAAASTRQVVTPSDPAIPLKVDLTDGVLLPPLNVTEIQQFIPHRYPFLLLDRVTLHVQGKYIEGYKNVSMNEPFFQGHFPNNPIMPGVLQVEALAQLGAVLVANMPQGQGKLAVLAGLDNIRFRRLVTPGDKLDLFGEIIKMKGPIGKAHCWAKVNGELCVEGEIMFSMINPDK